jgi:hypothetical protein
MLRLCYLLTLFIFLSCTNSTTHDEPPPEQVYYVSESDTMQRNKELLPEPAKDSAELAIPNNQNRPPGLYIDRLQSLPGDSVYYVTLYFRGDYDEQAVAELEASAIEINVNSDGEKRSKLDKALVEKYFYTDGLEKVVLFNTNQKAVDTLQLYNYEYYDNLLETSFIATYRVDREIAGLIVSAQNFDSEVFKSSPVFYNDTSRVRGIAARNGFNVEHLHYLSSAQLGSDTLSIISFADYSNGKECMYLLRNGVATDSVINDYVIIDLMPMPLAMNKFLLYVSETIVPETDLYWTALTGIDTQNFEFVFYERNRLPLNSINYLLPSTVK